VTVQQGYLAFHVIAKPIGPICNMDCTYCFYLEKENLYPGKKDFYMSDEVLENFIYQYIHTQNVPEIHFTWQGGEPTLLGVDFFRKVVALQRKYAAGKRIHNAVQTNGINIDENWCQFFKENKFLVGISIDGPQEFHDKYRVFKGGQPTFKKVMQAIELLKSFKVDFNTLTCVNRHNSYSPLKIYHFLKDIGSQYMQFIPIVERKIEQQAPNNLKLTFPELNGNAKVTEWSVEPLQYGKFLTEIFDEWVRRDVGKIYIQIFEVALQIWYGMLPTLCVFRETCGNALAIEHNGDLYSCDHYVYPEYHLGNILLCSIDQLINSEFQIQFGQNKQNTLPKYCLQCEYKFACQGECPKHRFTQTPDGEDGLNYLCAGYKHFFAHVDVYMKFMANELRNKRSPANVITWVKEKDQGFPNLKVGRNDPCPCGSGKKYKNCCGRNLK